MPPNLTRQPWRENLATGDIVRFRFPVDDPDNPQAIAKSRPCLVMGTRYFAGQKFVHIAYGTAAKSTANRGFEVRVNHPDARERAGLDRPTRFVCVRSIIVSVEHPGFEPDETTGSPIIGKLDASLMQRLIATKANLRCYGDSARSARRAAKMQERHRQRLRETRGSLDRNRGSRGATTCNQYGAPH